MARVRRRRVARGSVRRGARASTNPFEWPLARFARAVCFARGRLPVDEGGVREGAGRRCGEGAAAARGVSLSGVQARAAREWWASGGRVVGEWARACRGVRQRSVASLHERPPAVVSGHGPLPAVTSRAARHGPPRPAAVRNAPPRPATGRQRSRPLKPTAAIRCGSASRRRSARLPCRPSRSARSAAHTARRTRCSST